MAMFGVTTFCGLRQGRPYHDERDSIMDPEMVRQQRQEEALSTETLNQIAPGDKATAPPGAASPSAGTLIASRHRSESARASAAQPAKDNSPDTGGSPNKNSQSRLCPSGAQGAGERETSALTPGAHWSPFSISMGLLAFAAAKVTGALR